MIVKTNMPEKEMLLPSARNIGCLCGNSKSISTTIDSGQVLKGLVR